jgi:Mycothiol maleylpyruvate isomerase N-terminal domain
MNAQDILNYGHQTVLKAIDGIGHEAWETTGVVGIWTLKDVMAHLASFEQVLAEILSSLQDKAASTATLEQFINHPDFNNSQVALRKGQTPDQVYAEYQNWYQQVRDWVERTPEPTFKQVGILPWYGAEFDLEDFLVYTYYGHKREHSAQIALYKKRLT